MASSIASLFSARTGRAPEVLVRSPGRVNVIGEHTDHNLGWVLPAAIDLGTDVAARARQDGVVKVHSASLGADDEFAVTGPAPQVAPTWARFVRGYAQLLADAGIELVGADLVIDGDLPLGAGLSSSASLGLGVAVALLEVAGARVDPTVLARLGQRVENEVIGVGSGIMDQLAVARGRAGHVLLIDCRSFEVARVPLPPDLRLLVLDSAVPRRLTDSGYDDRRADCERALVAIRRIDPDVHSLRDATLDHLAAAGPSIDPVAARRARHVVTENQRVLDAVGAMRRAAGEELGALLDQSHASLRDDYEVSCAELDTLVELARATDGVLGARLTGAGFGGCAVALVAEPMAAGAAVSIIEGYAQATGRGGTAHVCRPSDGVRATRLSPRRPSPP